MKKQKLLLLVVSVAAIALELLPYGAVLNFATPEETVRQTYSYFDPTPFGYANFGPLLTAALTCVLFVLAAVYLFTDRPAINAALRIVSLSAAVLSLTPLLYGLKSFSVTGAMISCVLLLIGIVSLYTPARRK